LTPAMSTRVRRSAIGATIATVATLAVPAASYAVAGALDSAFGGDGRVSTDLSAHGDFAGAVAVQGDGKLVVAGSAAYDTRDPKFALSRYNADGTLDTSFGGGDGRVTTNFTRREDAVYGLAVQSDGKILAAGDAGFRTGDSRFALARYNSDGTLDTSFGGDGKVSTNWTSGDDPVSSLLVQPDGKIVVAGGVAQNRRNPRLAVSRYETDGTLDTTFGGDGKVTTDLTAEKDYANAVALQGDGKIIAGGIGQPRNARGVFELVRYNADGTLDATFSGNGKLTTNFTTLDDSVQGIVVLSDSDIVAGGIANYDKNAKFALARYNADGSLEVAFGGGDGKVTTDITPGLDEAWDIVLQPDGKVVAGGDAAGSGGRFAAVRYLTDGSLDPTFGTGGKATVNFTRRDDFAFGLTQQPVDGNLVLAGGSGWGGSNPKFAVARLLDD
jgi:uncharacterized delta-60 repeat protein